MFTISRALRALALVTAPVFVPSVLFAQQDERAEPVPGWFGDPAVWKVEGDVVVGDTHGVKLKANTFLIKDGTYGDFEFTCEFQLVGNNSGVQYRSRALPGAGYRVQGLQCDIHPNPPYQAMVYDEGGGGIVARHGQFVRYAGKQRDVLGELARPQARDFGAWHTLRVSAVGDVSWHELDGRVVTALLDARPNGARSGVLALQAHRGEPMVVRFRNLQLRELGADAKVPGAVRALLPKPAVTEVERPREPVPQWLWHAEVGEDDELFLRREFELGQVPESARLAVAADNNCRIFVNGASVGQDDSWESPTVVDVKKHLVRGANAIAIYAWNDGGPAGVAARLSWQEGQAANVLVSDPSWRCSDEDGDGWERAGFDAKGWAKATSYGALGSNGAVWSSQLGPDALGQTVDVYAPQVAKVTTEVQIDDAYDPDHNHPYAQVLLEVPRGLGSWVSLCADDRGRLYSCDQGGKGIYRIEPAAGPGGETTFTHMPADLSGAHGLLWFRDSLYAVVNGTRGQKSGLYRVTDSDGDDLLDAVELLRQLEGSGEHGPHSVEVAPDGEHLLVLCGNMTKQTETTKSRVASNWQEDRLVERINDARGFWGGYSPPGGILYQIDPDGKQWEIVCCGFRNPFDFAVLPTGRILIYDADMEWDMGMPWYRPTRWVWGQSGVDYGWRKGSAKWAPDYPEAPAPVVDIGPGSPTGMKYVPVDGGAVIGLDWTFGTVYRDGKPWWTGAPFPVADITWTARTPRCVYVVTGGRGLPSKLFRLPFDDAEGPPAVAPWDVAAFGPPEPWPEQETRSAAQILDDGETRGWPAARIALERLPAAAIRATVLQVDAARPDRAFAGLMALCRQGEPADRAAILDALGKFEWQALDHLQRIAWLRTHALSLLRLGDLDDAVRAAVAARLMPLFPAGDEREDADLCELLAYVDAPGLLAKAVPMLSPLRPSPPPDWAELATRNERYGSVIAKMRENMPPMGQLSIAHSLTMVDRGWTPLQRSTLVSFLGQARDRSGGASYDGFVLRILDAAVATFDAAELKALEFDVGRARAPKNVFQANQPKGPGRDWQLSDIPDLVGGGLADASRAAGKHMFWSAGCASCHYFEGQGGFGGPDLTSLKNKFRAEDVLESIIDPSKVISDQYGGEVLTKKDGTALFGVVRKTWDGDMEVYEVVEAKVDARPVRIPVDEVAKVEPSKMSPMPSDLIDRLSKREVRNLLAFLLGQGKKR